MSRRYTYSRTITTQQGTETFTGEQFDSFDEAKKAVDKGVYDRLLELGPKLDLDAPKYIPPASSATPLPVTGAGLMGMPAAGNVGAGRTGTIQP